MVSRSTVWLLSLLVAVGTTSGYVEPFIINGFQPEDKVNGLRTDKSEWSMMESLQKFADGAGNRLVEDRITVAARSSVLDAMLNEIPLQEEAPVVGARFPSLLSIVGILQAREGATMPVPLLPAAHMDGEPNLEAECDGQVAKPLSVETAVAAAVRAIKHSCVDLRQAAVDFVMGSLGQVLATEGWAHAVRTQPEEVVQLSRLLAEHFAATSTPATTQPTTTSKSTTTTTSQPDGDVSGHGQAADDARTPVVTYPNTPLDEDTTTTTTTTTTTISQPDGDVSRHGQAADDAPTPVVTCPNTPLDEDKVSAYRILPEEVKSKRLIEAAKEGQVEELRTLLAAGAFPNSRDMYRRTVLQWAVWRAQAEAASCLLDAGAGVDTTDDEGYQPLHMAAIGGNPDVVRLLAAWGADPNARDNWGWTPLHLTVREDKVEAALALLEAGADDEVRNHIWLTPLELARTEKYRNPGMEIILAEIHGLSPYKQ